MARPLAALALLIFTLPAPAQSPWHADYDAALAEAKQTGKPVLLDFGASWCGPCQTLEKQVFPDPAVSQFLARDYIAVKVNCDDGSRVADQYRVRSLPTLIVLSPDGHEVARRSGSADARDIAQWLNQHKARSAVAANPPRRPTVSVTADPWAAGHRQLALALATSPPRSVPR